MSEPLNELELKQMIYMEVFPRVAGEIAVDAYKKYAVDTTITKEIKYYMDAVMAAVNIPTI